MSKTDLSQDVNDHESAAAIFSDPIGFLAGLGIEAEVVAETSMPAAA